MKRLGYIWKIIENIITIVIVLGIFSVASSKFETVVLAILVLIYLNVRVGATGLFIFLDKELETIKLSLRKESNKEEDLLSEKEKGFQAFKKTTINKAYIDFCFQIIIYLIAIFNLLTALLTYQNTY